MRRAIIALGMLLARGSGAYALDPALDVSQYAHTAWKIRDGFSKGTVYAIAQTPDGYLWLGTEFGLLRFDGVRTVPWQPPEGQHLPDTWIRSLLAARDGTLWIGTRQGLVSWRDGKLTQYAKLAGQDVEALVEDREGTIWVGMGVSVIGRICAIQSGKVQCYGEDGRLGSAVLSLYEDSGGNLWAGAATGLWRWKPGPPKFYPLPKPPLNIIGLTEAADGTLLINMGGGVRQLVNGKVGPYPPLVGRDFAPGRIFRDRNGGLWIASQGQGLFHVHQGKTDVFAQSDGLSSDGINSIFEDHEGSIWISTGGGLDRFRDYAVATITVKQGLSNPAVWSVLAAKDSSVWLGTVGLNRWKGGQIAIYRKQSGLPDDRVHSLFQDYGGQIWVSTTSGVGHLEDGRFIRVKEMSNSYVTSITGDHLGNLWISDELHGLFHLTGGNVVQQIPWAKLGIKYAARALAVDSSRGGLWLGSFSGGVTYFKDGQVRESYAVADGLGEGRVDDLVLDRDGTLWASTEGGLSRVKNGRVDTLTTKNGLPCNTVHWMTEDDWRSVWLYTACGLVRIARTELDAWINDPKQTIQATVFDSSDGVTSHAFSSGNSPSVAKNTDGKLWFLPYDGVSVIDPRNLHLNKLPPPVHVEQITADRKTYDAAFDVNGDSSSHLRLPPLVRDLQIDYTALSFVAPEKIRFRVKLEGRDRDWQDVGARRQAFYTNLSPRKYRFRVMACNNSGVWNEAGAFLDFSVEPAYYQTTWFRFSCVAAFLGLLGALYQLRLRQVARQFSMRLEERVSERTRIARDLHDTLLQSFHGLLLRFQTASELFPTRPAEAKQTLDSAIEQAAQAITEGRDAVQGLRSSTVVTNDLALAINTLGEELAASETNPNAAESHVGVEGTPRNLHPILRDEVYRIAGEAMRNAFKHAQAQRIEVEIRYDERQFRLRVRDDGKGIDSKLLSEDERPGHYGMRGMRERAKLLGGKLTVWSEVEAGTEVELSIPAANAYATADGRRRSWLAEKFAGKLVEKDTERKS